MTATDNHAPESGAASAGRAIENVNQPEQFMPSDETGSVREGNKSASQTRPGDTGQAPESGEPGQTGRSHGRSVDPKGDAAEKSAAADGPSTAGSEKGNAGQLGEDFESGRQDAM